MMACKAEKAVSGTSRVYKGRNVIKTSLRLISSWSTIHFYENVSFIIFAIFAMAGNLEIRDTNWEIQ